MSQLYRRSAHASLIPRPHPLGLVLGLGPRLGQCWQQPPTIWSRLIDYRVPRQEGEVCHHSTVYMKLARLNAQGSTPSVPPSI